MYKEILIIIIVIILVVSLDIISGNYTKASVEKLTNELDLLRIEILEENKETSENKMEEIKKIWKEKYKLLAYYIEHDELEKVETELTRLEANIEVKEYKHCIEEIDVTIFILKHIQQKEKLDIKSIF